EWFMVHLCGRPIGPQKGFCILGRETALQNIYFDEEGWIRLKQGGNSPFAEAESPFVAAPRPLTSKRYTFDQQKLDPDFQSLRIPLTQDMMSLSERPGYLRLYGKESLLSTHKQT